MNVVRSFACQIRIAGNLPVHGNLQGHTIEGNARGATPSTFDLSAYLPNTNSAHQRCHADETERKSYLSANWT